MPTPHRYDALRMSVAACEDADEIRRGLYRLRRLCFMKMGLPNTGCWCIGAGLNGGHISCAEASQPMPIDTLGRADDIPRSPFTKMDGRELYGEVWGNPSEPPDRSTRAVKRGISEGHKR